MKMVDVGENLGKLKNSVAKAVEVELNMRQPSDKSNLLRDSKKSKGLEF